MEPRRLSRVDIGDKELADYAEAVGAEALERVRVLADQLRGARILHISSTPYGGGVAEHLSSQVPLLRDLGIEVDWRVLELEDRFIEVTKAMHNGLQGMAVEWDRKMEEVYEDLLRAHALGFQGEWDLIVAHDPQPAGLLAFLDELGDGRHRAARWVWRCHIDVSDGGGPVWDFLRPFVDRFDASVWTMEQFVPSSLAAVQPRHIFPPSIDPLTAKNAELSPGFVERACRTHGIDPARPLVVQVSRFDRWKDPVGVIEAFRSIRQRVPAAQLVLIGSMADDDPEGLEYWELANRTAAGLPDVHLLSDLDNRMVNALQRAADVVVQKSIREGFGLTVSEALWKGRPVVGGRVGGITLQIRDGVDGYLVDSAEEAADRTVELLADADRAAHMGSSGRRRVRENFLITREAEDYLRLVPAA
ncbi:MAG TPA: glycosyltransferase [Acidimicrobiales bacterium]|nr:glycosyltransferase [Acidimicrobiales bacterium]